SWPSPWASASAPGGGSSAASGADPEPTLRRGAPRRPPSHVRPGCHAGATRRRYPAGVRVRHSYRWALGAVLAVVVALTVGVAVAHPSADPGGGSPGDAATSLAPSSGREQVPDFTGIVRWPTAPAAW